MENTTQKRYEVVVRRVGEEYSRYGHCFTLWDRVLINGVKVDFVTKLKDLGLGTVALNRLSPCCGSWMAFRWAFEFVCHSCHREVVSADVVWTETTLTQPFNPRRLVPSEEWLFSELNPYEEILATNSFTSGVGEYVEHELIENEFYYFLGSQEKWNSWVSGRVGAFSQP